MKCNSSLKVQYRPAFNVGYVGMNQKIAPLNNLKVRQAIAYGLDRKSVVGAFYGGQGQVADQFLPPLVDGLRQEGRAAVHLQPGEGQAAAAGSGCEAPGRAGVLVPDRPPPRLHA